VVTPADAFGAADEVMVTGFEIRMIPCWQNTRLAG